MKSVSAKVSRLAIVLTVLIPTMISLFIVISVLYIDPPMNDPRGPFSTMEVIVLMAAALVSLLWFWAIALRLHVRSSRVDQAAVWTEGDDLYLIDKRVAPVGDVDFSRSGRGGVIGQLLVIRLKDGSTATMPLGQIQGALFTDVRKNILQPLAQSPKASAIGDA